MPRCLFSDDNHLIEPEDYPQRWYLENGEYYKVIGNIHDNPNWVKTEKKYKAMKVLVKSYTGTAKIWLDLPAIPQKGEELYFSMLDGLEGLTREEKRIAEESTAFLKEDEENENGNPLYFVTNRTFHNNGVVVLCVRTEEKVDSPCHV